MTSSADVDSGDDSGDVIGINKSLQQASSRRQRRRSQSPAAASLSVVLHSNVHRTSDLHQDKVSGKTKNSSSEGQRTDNMCSAPNSSTLMLICLLLVMMMTAKAASITKKNGHSNHSLKTHRNSSDGPSISMVPLKLDPSSLAPLGNFRSLESSSISPWTYNVTHGDYPFPVVEAHCLHKRCLADDDNLESRPIKRHVMLLRRVRSEEAESEAGPSYHYELETRLIAVGCTCVRPLVIPQ
ncbi:uncharacterized protein V6R79_017724 [Siganus canaliculatus]